MISFSYLQSIQAAQKTGSDNWLRTIAGSTNNSGVPVKLNLVQMSIS